LPVRDVGGGRGAAAKAGCRRGVSNDVRRLIADYLSHNMSRNSRHSGSGFEINSSQISKCIRLNFQFVAPDKRDVSPLHIGSYPAQAFTGHACTVCRPQRLRPPSLPNRQSVTVQGGVKPAKCHTISATFSDLWGVLRRLRHLKLHLVQHGILWPVVAGGGFVCMPYGEI